MRGEEILPDDIRPPTTAKELTPVITSASKDELKKMEEIKKESAFISYKMLLAGAIFSFFGSMFATAMFRWYDTNWAWNTNAALTIVIAAVFFISIKLVYDNIKKIKVS